jgi:hypothetical protein
LDQFLDNNEVPTLVELLIVELDSDFGNPFPLPPPDHFRTPPPPDDDEVRLDLNEEEEEDVEADLCELDEYVGEGGSSTA